MERAFIEFYDKFSISYHMVSKIIIDPEMEPRLQDLVRHIYLMFVRVIV